MSAPSLLHIFRAGTYQAMAGQTVTLTPADLAATAAAYDPARHEAPLVVGHPVDNGPAWGWVSGLSADGDDLRAAPRDIAAEFAEAVRARRYAKISASFWPPTHPANPAPGVWSLRHVGFLGAAVPAVLGLAPVSLADDAEGLVTLEADPLDFSSPADASAVTPEPTMPDPAAAPDADPTADFAAREAALTALQTDLAAREAALAEREKAHRCSRPRKWPNSAVVKAAVSKVSLKPCTYSRISFVGASARRRWTSSWSLPLASAWRASRACRDGRLNGPPFSGGLGGSRRG